MQKISLIIRTPMMKGLDASASVLAQGDFFKVYQLKLIPEHYPVLLKIKPCILLLSIFDAESSGDVQTFLKNFKEYRIAHQGKARSGAIRAVVISDRRISKVNWFSLGVYELIMGPVPTNILNFKLARHYQKALQSLEEDSIDELVEEKIIIAKEETKNNERIYQIKVAGGIESDGNSTQTIKKKDPQELQKVEEEWKLETLVVELDLPLKPEQGGWKPASRTQNQEVTWEWENKVGATPPHLQYAYTGELPTFNDKKNVWELKGEVSKLMLLRVNQEPSTLLESKITADEGTTLNARIELDVRVVKKLVYTSRDQGNEEEPTKKEPTPLTEVQSKRDASQTKDSETLEVEETALSLEKQKTEEQKLKKPSIARVDAVINVKSVNPPQEQSEEDALNEQMLNALLEEAKVKILEKKVPDTKQNKERVKENEISQATESLVKNEPVNPAAPQDLAEEGKKQKSVVQENLDSLKNEKKELIDPTEVKAQKTSKVNDPGETLKKSLRLEEKTAKQKLPKAEVGAVQDSSVSKPEEIPVNPPIKKISVEVDKEEVADIGIVIPPKKFNPVGSKLSDARNEEETLLKKLDRPVEEESRRIGSSNVRAKDVEQRQQKTFETKKVARTRVFAVENENSWGVIYDEDETGKRSRKKRKLNAKPSDSDSRLEAADTNYAEWSFKRLGSEKNVPEAIPVNQKGSGSRGLVESAENQEPSLMGKLMLLISSWLGIKKK